MGFLPFKKKGLFHVNVYVYKSMSKFSIAVEVDDMASPFSGYHSQRQGQERSESTSDLLGVFGVVVEGRRVYFGLFDGLAGLETPVDGDESNALVQKFM